MLRPICLYILLLAFVSGCNNEKTADTPSSGADTTNKKSEPTAETKSPDLPPYVVLKNWEAGNVQHTQLVLNVYKAWDSGASGEMESYFADSTKYDFPDGTRYTTTNKTVASKFRQWRNAYKETSNIPFSLISLHNKDLDQEWVIAWTWNKWRYDDGKKDSMLYCDNWRIKDGRIEYLNSLQNRPSKALSTRLNTAIPK